MYFSAWLWQVHQAFPVLLPARRINLGEQWLFHLKCMDFGGLPVPQVSEKWWGEDWWPAGIKVAIIYFLTSSFVPLRFPAATVNLLWQMAFTTITSNTGNMADHDGRVLKEQGGDGLPAHWDLFLSVFWNIRNHNIATMISVMMNPALSELMIVCLCFSFYKAGYSCV